MSLDPQDKPLRPIVSQGSVVIDEAYLSYKARYHFLLAEHYAFLGYGEKILENYRLSQTYAPQSSEVAIKLAEEYIRGGSIELAIKVLEAAREQKTGNYRVSMMLGGLYTALQRFSLGETLLQESLALNGKNYKSHIYLGSLYSQQGKNAKAAQVFRKLLTITEDDESRSEIYYFLGRLSEKGSGLKSLAYYKKSLEAAPHNSDTLRAVSHYFRKQKKGEALMRFMREYQKTYGASYYSANILVDGYLANEEYEKALQQALLMNGLQPSISLKMQVGFLYVGMSKHEQAVEYFEEILKEDPGLDKVLFYLAALYEEMGFSHQAVEKYQKISVDSDFYIDSVMRGTSLMSAMGQDAEVRALMEASLQNAKEELRLYTYYATYLNNKKDFSKSYEVLKVAEKFFPNTVELLFFQAVSLDGLGKKLEVVEKLKQVIDLDSESVKAMNYLAYVYAELGQNLDAAVALSRKALSKLPKDPYILDTLGWALYKRGDIQGALKYLSQSYALNPNENVVAEHLGDVYYSLKKMKHSKAMYDKVLLWEKDQEKIANIQKKIANIKALYEQGERRPASNP